jgi:hypothetical protein
MSTSILYSQIVESDFEHPIMFIERSFQWRKIRNQEQNTISLM